MSAGSRPGRTAPSGSPTGASDSIGRITTAGAITNYTGPGIDSPVGRSRPAPTAPCGSPAEDSIGRITHRRRRHQLHRPQHRTSRRRSRPGPTAPSGSPTAATTRSGGSRTSGDRHAATPARRHRLPATGSRRGLTAPSGSPTAAATRSGGSPPAARSRSYTDPSISSSARDHGRARRRPVVHQQRRRLDRADHHRAAPVTQLHRPEHQRSVGDHGRAGRRPVVHQLRQQLDRADHHHRRGHQLHRPRHQRPGGSRPGPTAPCGSPTRQRLDRADHHRRRRQRLRRHRVIPRPRHRHRGCGAVTSSGQSDERSTRFTPARSPRNLARESSAT